MFKLENQEESCASYPRGSGKTATKAHSCKSCEQTLSLLTDMKIIYCVMEVKQKGSLSPQRITNVRYVENLIVSNEI